MGDPQEGSGLRALMGAQSTAQPAPAASQPGDSLRSLMAQADPYAAPKAQPSNLSTNELMLTSLGGPWANDSRLTEEQKQQLDTGNKVGALSGAVTGALPFTPEAVSAIATMAKAHPVAAGLIKKALTLVGGAEVYKHHQWLMDLLP